VTGCTFNLQRYRTVRETQNPSPYSSNIKKSRRFTAMPLLRPRVLRMVNFTLSSWSEVEPGSSVGIVTALRPELSGIRKSGGAGRTSRPQNVQTASGAHPTSCLLGKAAGTWIWPLPSFRMSVRPVFLSFTRPASLDVFTATQASLYVSPESLLVCC
jgi:hypothetical protein